jgi:UDP-glucose 4-epimerase
MSELALVTGGCGFIGSTIVRALLARGDRVRVLDDLSSGRRENLAGLAGVELLQDDLRSKAACEKACAGVAVVYHQAARPSVPRSIEDPQGSFDVNVVGTHHLLLAARAARVRRVVLASSSSVYGDQPALPKREDQPPAPMSPYAAQKLAAEQLALAFSRSMGLEAVALRYFNVFGPRQDPNSAYAAVVPAFSSKLLAGQAPVIYGDGGQTRDFSFVEDVARANLLAGSAPAASGLAINVAGGQRVSLLELFELLARLCGAQGVRPRHAPARTGDIRDSLASIDRAREALGWRPEVGLEEGLRRTVAALREPAPAR